MCLLRLRGRFFFFLCLYCFSILILICLSGVFFIFFSGWILLSFLDLCLFYLYLENLFLIFCHFFLTKILNEDKVSVIDFFFSSFSKAWYSIVIDLALILNFGILYIMDFFCINFDLLKYCLIVLN